MANKSYHQKRFMANLVIKKGLQTNLLPLIIEGTKLEGGGYDMELLSTCLDELQDILDSIDRSLEYHKNELEKEATT